MRRSPGRGRYRAAAVDAFQAIVLGIVQGLTEFLPISSTGHLRIVPAFLGWEDPGAAFTAVTQLGTMAAVLLYFRTDLWNIARTWFLSLRAAGLRGELDARMGWYIGLGTIPIAIFGLVFSDQIESGARSLYLIGTTLIVLGLLLLVADKLAKRDREISTITRARRRVDRLRAGARAGAGRLALRRDDHRGPDRRLRPGVGRPLLVPAVGPGRRALRALRGAQDRRRGRRGSRADPAGDLLAFVVGYASIAWLLRWLGTHSMGVFVVYRVALGALVIALTAAGTISYP